MVTASVLLSFYPAGIIPSKQLLSAEPKNVFKNAPQPVVYVLLKTGTIETGYLEDLVHNMLQAICHKILGFH